MTMVHSVQGVSWGRSWDFPPCIAIVTEADAEAEVEKKGRKRAGRNEALEGRETAISRLADGFLAVTDDRGAWQDARDLGTCSLDGVFVPSSPMFGNFILAFHSGNRLELSQLH
ncbi:hypothetical protein LTR29_016623 [Friedmanniomyces endolithicus]|uniref:Uncharacterized protein n=1 Tax=Rachicladosporium monterosium TaxID=1507873 RepID=A0ABR0LH18_9PEZI|nr:hypothetical protein LTR29_016623 [Friedmanniomyces endolithicus]KAK5148646.1 hypothetical protein LTR32_000004 [Rachicladosporium monterosium]